MAKKTLSFLATALFSSLACADIIKCYFTEPFIQTTYSMAQQTLSLYRMDEQTEIIKNVSFQIKEAGKFEIVAKDGEILQELTLNHNGSDGMSENVYPYEVKWGVFFGGCSSNYLKIKKPGQ